MGPPVSDVTFLAQEVSWGPTEKVGKGKKRWGKGGEKWEKVGKGGKRLRKDRKEWEKVGKG